MMMTWISDKAVKWILYILAPLIVIGLLFMGMTGLTTQKEPSVGIVNGVKLNNSEFKNALQASERQNTQQGRRLTDKQRSESRRQLFDQMIVSQLLKEKVDENELRASIFEMRKELMENPHPSFKRSPEFMTDSVFDLKKYQAWFQNDSVFDQSWMVDLEADLRDNRVPMNQLQLFVSAKQHMSDLERRFAIQQRDNKYDIEYLSVSLDSFGIKESDVTEKEITEYYTAHQDSFTVAKAQAKFDYLSVTVAPSAYDDTNAKLHTQWVLDQIKSESSDFAQMAKTNSEDLASAPQGGSLGDYVAPEQWVKPFADVAFALKEGEISAPVKTQFGYHLIKSHGKKVIDGKEKAKLSHILVKVTAGPETIDSLRLMLENVKTQVLAGNSFESVSKENNLVIKKSEYIARGDSIDALGYLVGLSDFGFVDRDNKEPVSRVLQNEKVMALFSKAGELAQGTTSLEFFKSDIKKSVLKEKKVAAAKAYLKQQLATLGGKKVDSTTVATIAKLGFDSAEKITASGFIPKVSYGYGSSVVAEILKQTVNSWGEPKVGMGYAIAAQVTAKLELSEQELAEKVKLEQDVPANQYARQSAFNTWAMNLKEMAIIEDNLDLFYSE
ncbi:MAG: peptidylprolyl isomerase [Fibrobacterales bacterium]